MFICYAKIVSHLLIHPAEPDRLNHRKSEDSVISTNTWKCSVDRTEKKNCVSLLQVPLD